MQCAPIHAQAEVEDTLPGLAVFLRSIAAPINHAVRQSAQWRIETWNIARSILEFAQRPEVRARIFTLNHCADGRRRPGRPKTAISLVIDAAVAQGLASDRSLERWVRQWEAVSAVLDIQAHCSEEQFERRIRVNPATLPVFVEGVLEQARSKRGRLVAFTPERWTADKLRALERVLVNREGSANPLPRAYLRCLARSLRKLLKPHGIVVRNKKEVKP